MMVSISAAEEFAAHKELIETYAQGVLALDTVQDSIAQLSSIPIVLHTDESKETELVETACRSGAVGGLSGAYVSNPDTALGGI